MLTLNTQHEPSIPQALRRLQAQTVDPDLRKGLAMLSALTGAALHALGNDVALGIGCGPRIRL